MSNLSGKAFGSPVAHSLKRMLLDADIEPNLYHINNHLNNSRDTSLPGGDRAPFLGHFGRVDVELFQYQKAGYYVQLSRRHRY